MLLQSDSRASVPGRAMLDLGALLPSSRFPAARTSEVALWMAVWAIAWITLLSALSWSPPTDSVEQLTWVRSVEWGYYKHPPLPTILIWPLVRVFGIHEWVVGVAGALVISAALLISWRLVRELAGRHFAALALLGSLCITYYSTRTNFYNHNTVLLPFVAAAAWFCWRAFADRSQGAWLALGLMLGLGALAKYQVALAGVSVIAYWLVKRGWRDMVHVRGLLAAGCVAAVVFAPHLWWLVAHDFLPFQYASRTSLGAAMPCVQRTAHALHWLADQCNRASPALLLAAGLLWKTRRAAVVPPGVLSAREVPEIHPDARRFLFAWGLLPLLTVVLIGLATGADLQFQWGTAFMSFTCAALMLCVPAERWQRVAWRHALAGFVVVQLLLAAMAWATSPVSGLGLSKSRSAEFRSAQLAARIGPQARIALDGPIRVITGPARIASALSLRLSERPLVLLEGDLVASPWVSPAHIERHGMLWVGDDRHAPPPGLNVHWETEQLWWAVQPPLAGRVDEHY